MYTFFSHIITIHWILNKKVCRSWFIAQWVCWKGWSDFGSCTAEPGKMGMSPVCLRGVADVWKSHIKLNRGKKLFKIQKQCIFILTVYLAVLNSTPCSIYYLVYTNMHAVDFFCCLCVFLPIVQWYITLSFEKTSNQTFKSRPPNFCNWPHLVSLWNVEGKLIYMIRSTSFNDSSIGSIGFIFPSIQF